MREATSTIFSRSLSARAAASITGRAGERDLSAPHRFSLSMTMSVKPSLLGSSEVAPEFHQGPPSCCDTVSRRPLAARASSLGSSQPWVKSSRPGSRMSAAELGPIISWAVALRTGVTRPHPAGARSRPGPRRRKGMLSAAALLLSRPSIGAPAQAKTPERRSRSASGKRGRTRKSGSNAENGAASSRSLRACSRGKPAGAGESPGLSSHNATAIAEARSYCRIPTSTLARGTSLQS